jgi:hypothetical protein
MLGQSEAFSLPALHWPLNKIRSAVSRTSGLTCGDAQLESAMATSALWRRVIKGVPRNPGRNRGTHSQSYIGVYSRARDSAQSIVMGSRIRAFRYVVSAHQATIID